MLGYQSDNEDFRFLRKSFSTKILFDINVITKFTWFYV